MFDFNTQTVAVGAFVGAAFLASQQAKGGTVIADLPDGNQQSTTTNTAASYVFPFPTPVANATGITIALDAGEGGTLAGIFAGAGSPPVTATVEVVAFVDSNGILLEQFGINDSDDGVSSLTALNGRSYTFDAGTLEAFSFIVTPDFGTGSGTAFAAVDNFISGQQQLVVTTIPEPSSLALLGVGGLLAARRRRGA